MGLWSVYLALRILQGIPAIILNLITIICFNKFSFVRSPSHILLASLAGSDLLHGLTLVVLLPIKDVFTTWPVFKNVCRAVLFADGLTVFVQYSMFSLLSIERFNSLKAQLGQTKKWGRKKTIILMSSSWIIMTVWMTVSLAVFSDPAENSPCTIDYFFPPIFSYVGFSIFIVTTCITLLFYGRISCLILERSINSTAASAAPPFMNTSQIERRKAEIRITKMIGMVVGFFFMTYVPFGITILSVKQDSPPVFRFFYYLAINLLDVNFWINPVIYAWRDKGFRRALKLLFRKWPCFKHRVAPIPDIGSDRSNTAPRRYRMQSRGPQVTEDTHVQMISVNPLFIVESQAS